MGGVGRWGGDKEELYYVRLITYDKTGNAQNLKFFFHVLGALKLYRNCLTGHDIRGDGRKRKREKVF